MDGANATGADTGRARMQHAGARLQPTTGGDATSLGSDATTVGRECNARGRRCNTLNPVNLLVNLLEQLDINSTNPETGAGTYAPPPEEPVVVEAGWDLALLLKRNQGVKAETKRGLMQGEASPQAFVSWLLYTASSNGAGITHPALFTASKLNADPQTGAGPCYDRLAALSPKSLYTLVEAAINGSPCPANLAPAAQQDWHTVMDNSTRERLQALKGGLFG